MLCPPCSWRPRLGPRARGPGYHDWRAISMAGPDGSTGYHDRKCLDVIAWVAFTDALPGQLIIFTQCKTGTTWRNSLALLQPLKFCEKWFHAMPIADPMRAYCVAEAADRSRWNSDGIDSGILFDRCRLVDFSGGLNASIHKSMRHWTDSAFKSVNV
jgi:hypothetical protein